MRHVFLSGTALLLALLGVAVAVVGWQLTRPLPIAAQELIEIHRGESLGRSLKRLADAGVVAHPETLRWWARLRGDAASVHAGEYLLEAGLTHTGLLEQLVAGRVHRRHFTIVEGWRFSDLRAALGRAPRLTAETAELSDEEIMAQLGRVGQTPEGRFFPATYDYLAGSSDLALLGRALARMERTLAQEWSNRSFALPLDSPEEALILASIIEKETGLRTDRPKVAAVLLRRLELGMRLQTDPTVIYGLGPEFEGPLTRNHLRTPTPWNTYVHHGLPPTPIAMPGIASLRAALHPADTDALYFVARGDGSSHFSASLEEHNAAVRRYLRGGAAASEEGGP